MDRFITLRIQLPDHSPEAQQSALAHILHRLRNTAQRQPELKITEVLDGPHHVELEDVRNFHDKFQVPMAPWPHFLDKDAHDFRKKFMEEELIEFHDAYLAGNMHEAADSLIDLVYVTVGTALMMGLPWAELWAAVQERNMAKELALPDGSNSKRNNPLDVIKPEGWYPPNHWPALSSSPETVQPVFNATAAVLHLAEQRRISAEGV